MPDRTKRSLSPRVKFFLKYAASAALTLLFLYLAFRGTDFRSLLDALASANYWWIIPSLAAMLTSHYVRAWRWRYLLDPMKPHVGLRNLFSGVMIGYMVNNVLPRAGELARPYAISKLESIPGGAALGTIVVERVMDIVTFLLIVAALPLLYYGPLEESFPWLAQAGIITAAATLLLVIIAVVLMVRRDWTTSLIGLFTRFLPQRLGRRVEKLSHSFLDGFLFLKRPRNFVVIGVLSVLIWFLYALSTYVAFYAFGLENTLHFREAVVTLAISSIGVAIPTPGATGSYHALTSQTLVKLFAVNQALALSYATVTHAAQFVVVTIIGLYYFLKDRISFSLAVRKEEPPA